MAADLVVIVYVRVRPESVDEFRGASEANAEASLREPGVVRFDLLQELESPTRFALVEVYRDEAAALAHKQTAHYLAWRDTVAGMMAEPRSSTRYASVHP